MFPCELDMVKFAVQVANLPKVATLEIYCIDLCGPVKASVCGGGFVDGRQLRGAAEGVWMPLLF